MINLLSETGEDFKLLDYNSTLGEDDMQPYKEAKIPFPYGMEKNGTTLARCAVKFTKKISSSGTH